MQSANMRTSFSKLNPYLSQYKDDISAKQQQIRQRLGSAPPADSNSLNEGGNIPSIDDDAEEQIQSSERKYKNRFSYFDNETEESLQFFKKNLLPTNAKSKSNTASNLFEAGRLASEPRAKEIPIKRDRPQPLSTNLEPKVLSSITSKYKLGSERAGPPDYSHKLNEFKLTDRSSSPAARTPTSTFRESSARELRDYDSPTNRGRSIKSTSSAVQESSLTQAPTNTTTTERPKIHRVRSPNRSTDQQDSRVDSKSIQSVDSRRSADSPSQNSTFTRKPLYNSLLRAHDSIRLKVNRPKIRPKSATENGLENLETSPKDLNVGNNERAIDVKRSSSRRKSGKKKDKESKESQEKKDKVPVRNFTHVRIVKIVRSDTERSIGVTVRAEDGNIVVARIMAGSLADKQAALQVGDIILSVNNREVYTPEQLQEELRLTLSEDTVIMKVVPSFREELPTLCVYLRALFSYDANEDSLLPCKEVGVSFNQGDILEVVNQEDPNWWQARRVDSENLQTGLIPSQDLEERRRAFVIPDYDLATRTSICGTKVSRKSKKKEIYNVGQNSDFDKAELLLYEEVCRTPAFERRTLVLVGANGVGKQAFKARLLAMDPDRFGTPLPHTSRLPRDGEEDRVHYHFVTREQMEEDIIAGRYLEYGEYDGALYGTKLDSIREIIGSGKVCVLDCSATCLKVLKTSDYLPFVAFIAAPTLDQLRYMHEWARSGGRNYATFDRALSRQSRRARTLQDFAFDFFEDEDLQGTVEESARLFRMYENYFDIVLINNNFDRTFEQLKDAIDALSMAPQWIPISWIYGT